MLLCEAQPGHHCNISRGSRTEMLHAHPMMSQRLPNTHLLSLLHTVVRWGKQASPAQCCWKARSLCLAAQGVRPHSPHNCDSPHQLHGVNAKLCQSSSILSSTLSHTTGQPDALGSPTSKGPSLVPPSLNWLHRTWC